MVIGAGARDGLVGNPLILQHAEGTVGGLHVERRAGLDRVRVAQSLARIVRVPWCDATSHSSRSFSATSCALRCSSARLHSSAVKKRVPLSAQRVLPMTMRMGSHSPFFVSTDRTWPWGVDPQPFVKCASHWSGS